MLQHSALITMLPCTHIASNAVFYERTKYIKINYNFVRERIQNESLKVLHIYSQHQVASILTKPLFPAQFQTLLNKMGV